MLQRYLAFTKEAQDRRVQQCSYCHPDAAPFTLPLLQRENLCFCSTACKAYGILLAVGVAPLLLGGKVAIETSPYTQAAEQGMFYEGSAPL